MYSAFSLRSPSAAAASTSATIRGRRTLQIRSCSSQLRGVTAPVDRYHERADVVGRHDLIRFARNDRGHGDHEVLAEVAPRIAGDGVSHLAHEIAHVLLREL